MGDITGEILFSYFIKQDRKYGDCVIILICDETVVLPPRNGHDARFGDLSINKLKLIYNVYSFKRDEWILSNSTSKVVGDLFNQEKFAARDWHYQQRIKTDKAENCRCLLFNQRILVISMRDGLWFFDLYHLEYPRLMGVYKLSYVMMCSHCNLDLAIYNYNLNLLFFCFFAFYLIVICNLLDDICMIECGMKFFQHGMICTSITQKGEINRQSKIKKRKNRSKSKSKNKNKDKNKNKSSSKSSSKDKSDDAIIKGRAKCQRFKILRIYSYVICWFRKFRVSHIIFKNKNRIFG